MNSIDEMGELRHVQTLEGHTDRVWGLAWNPTNTNLLASCSGDKTVRIWEQSPSSASFHCKAVLEETHTRTIRSCAWSPSGNMLATASFDATTAIWENIGGDFECISTLEGHENEVKSVSWNAAGSLIATCGRDKSVWIWEVEPGNEFECVSVLQGHTQDVKMVQWHPTVDVLFSCSYDNSIKIWAEDGVNIGCSRPSLMDIKHYKEPFIFPLFDTSKENDVTCPPSSVLEKNLDISHFKQAFLEEDDELADDDVEVDFEDEEFEGHVNEDTMDFDEVQTGNLIQVNSNGTDSNLGNFEYQLDGNGNHLKIQTDSHHSVVKKHRSTYDIHSAEEMWANVRKGTKILVQVVKEGLGKKGPTLTAYPKLRSRFWVLITRCKSIGVSKKISGVERTRLRVIAKSLQPPGFGVTIRTVAAGHSVEELRKDLEGLLATWRNIVEHAKSAALAADEGVEGAIPVILHQAMGQTLSVVQDYFNEKVKRMVVDSPRTYHEVTNYLQDIAPELCGRVELHRKNVPLFDEFNIEEEINNILNKRVALPNGGSLVIEQTEALVSIDVNGGHGMFGQGASQEKAIVDVNLAAAKQIARELRLRDIGGIIVVDFIDMMDDSNKRLVYEEVKKAVERDRSIVKVSELSKHGLMEITRKRVRPSVTFMVSEPCTCCHGTGRIEALETSFSKIEHEICRLLATVGQKADPESPKSWPRLLLRVDSYMSDYLTSGKRTRLATLSSSLKVWILLKVARNFARGAFEVRLLADEKGITNQQQVGGATQSAEAATIIPTKRTKLFPVKRWKAGRKL